MLRPAHLLPAVVATFGLLPLGPLARGDGQPGPKAALPALPKQPAGDPKLPPPVRLPVTRVTLFNAGVAHFHREGDVTGDARLDLRFDEADVNDLLKTLVLTDKDGGKARAVTYDNRMPLDFTLKGFAVDVTENPTMGQLMHQVRGEKVEVTDKTGVPTVGQIVSVERQPVPPTGVDPGELLNLLTDDGLQTVELKQLKKIKFVRAELQAEFKKALEMLATARGDNKKAVSVVFTGVGKRKVAVGYVSEAPLWKPSYRLTVDEKGAARIQGWATVENTTDEDWTDVKVGLVAGRPLTFQMDLYDPLFVPRPMVEPDLFASLRPPMYQGGLTPTANMGVAMGGANFLGGQFGGGQFGGGQFGNNPLNAGGAFGAQGVGGGAQGLAQFGGNQGANQLGGNFGLQGGQFGGFQGGGYGAYLPRVPRPSLRNLYGDRLSYSEYVNRVRGNPTPSETEKPPTVRDPLDKQAGALAAADGKLGDMFEYAIEHPVTLARQKSALLPLVDAPVEGSRVSIFNAETLAKHPLLGLKLVNKTKLHLAQGPVAVYDGGTFAGDARLPDVKPNETRLVSYAIDLGTEVVARPAEPKRTLLSVSVAGGQVTSKFAQRRDTKYEVRNRNPVDRAVIVEHPIVPEWKLVAPAKPDDRTRSFYRFELAVKSGALATLDVAEESTNAETVPLINASRSGLDYFANLTEAKPAVRDVFKQLIALRDGIDAAQKSLADEQAALKEIADDQERIRKNIERTPKESDAFKRYVKKFDEQETEIEKRQARVRELRQEAVKKEAALRDFAATAKAE
jgi:hypothetical protein